MAVARDLYQVLGVQPNATDDDIRKAYRRLARELHPDVNQDPAAEERFKEIAGAYEILSDPDKRARYDAFGAAGGPAASRSPTSPDIFEMFFGQGGFGGFGARRRAGPRGRARDGARTSPSSTPRRSPRRRSAVRREVELERLGRATDASAWGAEPGTAPIACRTCGGAGEVQSMRRSVFGTLMTTSPCQTCDGTGQEIPDPCERCFGKGRVRDAATVTVEIPAGVSDGMELRVAGAGHAGVAGGRPGDLFVRLGRGLGSVRRGARTCSHGAGRDGDAGHAGRRDTDRGLDGPEICGSSRAPSPGRWFG